nr:PREDICTED: uncharacterized protein LOC105662853 [Megachile rotundata]
MVPGDHMRNKGTKKATISDSIVNHRKHLAPMIPREESLCPTCRKEEETSFPNYAMKIWHPTGNQFVGLLLLSYGIEIDTIMESTAFWSKQEETAFVLQYGDIHGSKQANEIRRLTTNTLKSAKTPTPNLTKSEQKALQDIRKRKDILILPADKGNMTVIMDRNEYDSKQSPPYSVERTTTTLIKNAKLPDHITKAILPKESNAPRLYGLLKIHKPNIPLRPIVSTIGSPTYTLSKYLTSVLKPLTGNTPSSITNSFHFISKIQDIRTLPHDILVSFDVQSLFTNVPIKRSIEIIQDKVPENLVPLIQHCLNTNYFIFQDTYYEQVSGAAMGSPISPVVADIYMEYLENYILNNAPLKPSQWFRYVDDTFVVWSHGREKLGEFLDYINSLDPNIQFTMEIENPDRSLPFLDTLITRKADGTLGHKVYRKPTHTNRYVHATSHHHPSKKNSVITSLIHRATCISEKENLANELEHIRSTLQQNGYSRQN